MSTTNENGSEDNLAAMLRRMGRELVSAGFNGFDGDVAQELADELGEYADTIEVIKHKENGHDGRH